MSPRSRASASAGRTLFAAVLCESIKRIFEERICQVHVSQVAFNGLPERRVYPIFISALWV
jgi:hypothetical protein